MSFDEYFMQIYGERWSRLKSALEAAKHHVPLKIINEETYWIDQASICAAKALEVTPGDRVLDMCAAPGGKSLVLLDALRGEGELICNEISRSRRDRLKSVLRTFGELKDFSHVSVMGVDGERLGMMKPQSFNRILIDAPCSGERHLLERPSELNKWSVKRGKKLASRQYSLLCSAELALSSPGRIVYSTCSINPMENDEVVAKFFKKKGKNLKSVRSLEFNHLEKTEYGYMILPDIAEMGPLYFAILETL